MIKAILDKYKMKGNSSILQLISIKDDCEVIGYLRPITEDFESSTPTLVHDLGVWRGNSATAATGTFEITDERTKRWVEKLILNNDKRILFIVTDINNNFIGQVGLADINEAMKCADLDAILRGKEDYPGIMGKAIETLMNWGITELGIEDYYLDCFNDNTHAIKFYENHSFVEVGRIALKMVHYENEDKWEIDKSIDPINAERCYVRMKRKHK